MHYIAILSYLHLIPNIFPTTHFDMNRPFYKIYIYYSINSNAFKIKNTLKNKAIKK